MPSDADKIRAYDLLEETLRSSIQTMDERGRKVPDSGSYMLWGSEWRGMRRRMWEALEQAVAAKEARDG